MKLQDLDFRVWDNKRKKYIENYVGILKLFVFDKNTSDMKKAIELHELPNGFEEEFNLIDDGELELYSSFQDKNGKKIYEGDIVRYRGQNLLISYERATWYIIDLSIDENIRVDCGTRLQGILECMKYYQNIDTENQIDVEVIGNIHENKNLLDDSIEQNEPSNTNKTRRVR